MFFMHLYLIGIMTEQSEVGASLLVALLRPSHLQSLGLVTNCIRL